MRNKFRTDLGRHTFYNKYALTQNETWHQRAQTIVDFVCGTAGGTEAPLLSQSDRDKLVDLITEFKFLPGGRYIYYAGRPAKFYNNCYLFRGLEDTREEWSEVARRCTNALMTGGGVGVDYSVFRPQGALLSRTGGEASGPIPLMYMINEIGRNVMQGGSRRSAIYASLNWRHEDIPAFLTCKNWDEMEIGEGYTIWDAKQRDFNYPAPLDMTNISVNYDDAFLEELYNSPEIPWVFHKNVEQALRTGEPGFSFNFGDKQNETLRNACTEVTSEDDSDVCNLGSVNMGAIDTLKEMEEVCYLASKFLLCGTIRAVLPDDKIRQVREQNRRLGLGLMGVHEWLLRRGYRYEVVPEMHDWLGAYRDYSERGADEVADYLGVNHPVAYRAIAPAGTISILAGTTSGIEPLYAVAYKRRYLTGGDIWKYEYAIDHTAQTLIEEHGIPPERIETAQDLAKDPERRIAFQADVQDYVDMAISSTINLPEWGSRYNGPHTVKEFARILAKYAPRLRGFTCYPDGSRGGQPLTAVSYEEAKANVGVVFEENDSCKGGVCGI